MVPSFWATEQSQQEHQGEESTPPTHGSTSIGADLAEHLPQSLDASLLLITISHDSREKIIIPIARLDVVE